MKPLFKPLITLACLFTCLSCTATDKLLSHPHDCSCEECLHDTYQDELDNVADVEYRKPAEPKEDLGKYLVNNSKSDYVIVIPDEASETTKYAAEELQKYVNAVSNTMIFVKAESEVSFDTDKEVISIDDTVYKKQLVTDVDYTELKTGGYYLRSYGTTYIIDSACNEGRLYGVYEFLNAFFDIEFLTYDDTYLPQTTLVRARAINYLTIPAFDIRDYYYYSVWYQGVGWGAKLRSNSSSYKSSKRVTGDYAYDYYGFYYNNSKGEETFAPREGHTIQDMLRVDAYRRGFIPDPNYKTSENGANPTLPVGYATLVPAWYAYNKTFNRGMTADHRSEEEVCYTNGLDSNFEYVKQDYDIDNDNQNLTKERAKSLCTKIIEICVKMIIEEKSTKAVNLMLGQADFDCMCMCDSCQRLRKLCENPDYPGSGFGGSIAVWANQISRAVKAELVRRNITREVKFVIFAYSKGIIPPVKKDKGNYVPVTQKAVLDSDILVKMAYRYCVYHSLWDESCVCNQKNRNIFSGWQALVTGEKPFVIWDYTCNFTNYLFYLPNFGSIPSNYKYYQQLGVTHLLSQGSPSEYNYYESNLHAWTSTKLMWDPSLNVTALNKQFNKLYFTEKYATYVDSYRAWMDSYYARKDATTPGSDTTYAGHHVATDSTYDVGMEDKNNYDLNHLFKACDVLETALIKLSVDPSLTSANKENLESKIRSALITPQFMILWMFKEDLESNQVKSIATDFFKSISLLGLTYMREGQVDSNSFEAWKENFDL